VQYCESENLYLDIRCDYNVHHIAWGTNCNDRGEAAVEFLNSSNLEIPNQGYQSTLCSGCSLEVSDITMGSFGFLESIKSWEVSSKSSLLDHRIFCSLYRAPYWYA
jgi:hypothetical protein